MQNMNIPACPRCGHNFPPNFELANFIDHVRGCSGSNKNPNKAQQKQQYYYEKVPVIANNLTKFKWQKKIKVPLNYHAIDKLDAKQIINNKLTFQQKQYWFRRKLQQSRISWTQGAQFLNIDKENILIDSLNQVKTVNMLKELKINFKNQKVNDAGGLLREWIYMVIKQIFNINTGIFSIANTEEIMYKLKWDEETDQYFSKQLLCLYGIVLAKSIFEKVPINSYIDRTIIRQLCGQTVKLQDIYGYDEELYRNWKHLLQNPNAQELQTYFVILSHSGQTLKQVQILPDGKQLLVNDENKQLFVQLSIQMLTGDKVYRSINAIREGIQMVFPSQYLSIFEPYQVEMLLYGVPFIDIQQWFDNTQYKQPYSKDHKIIKWFWNIMETFDQEQLGKILHFCTGSSRTPIHGFSKLESNRGNYSKFLIVSTQYNNKNPFPKGHTCFNRLQLPLYPSQQILQKYLFSISKSELDGIFGLD